MKRTALIFAAALAAALMLLLSVALHSSAAQAATPTPTSTPTPVSKVQDPNTIFYGVFWCTNYTRGTPPPIADCANVRNALDDKNGDGNPNDPWQGWASEKKKLLEGAAATKANLAAAIATVAAQVTPGNEVVVFTSSHGTTGCAATDDTTSTGNHGNEANDEPDGFDDAIKDESGANITDDELSDMLSIFPKGITITVILQACHVGGFVDGKADLLDIRDKDGNRLDPRYVEVLMSSRANELSYGPDLPDTSSYFGNAVRDCLRQKDATGKTVADADFGNNDGVTTSKELFSCAKSKTEQHSTPETPQHPLYAELPWVGGIAEAPDVDVSALGATVSGGSSATTYAVIAGIAAGSVLLGAGGWYARRRYSVRRR